jgi:hypothetical protein
VRLSPLGTSATIWPVVPAADDKSVGGMKIGRGNRSTRRKSVPVPLCLPQIPHDLTWARTLAAAVGSPRLTAWAVARPKFYLFLWGGTKSTRYCGHFWSIVQAPDDRWGWLWSNWWNEDWQGKPKYSEKTYPSATLSTTNPTWPDPDSNPGRRGGTSKILPYSLPSLAGVRNE